jgi:hypothetical protein
VRLPIPPPRQEFFVLKRTLIFLFTLPDGKQ